MTGSKLAEVHTTKEKPRPVSLEEYRSAQNDINQRMDCIIAILMELKTSY